MVNWDENAAAGRQLVEKYVQLMCQHAPRDVAPFFQATDNQLRTQLLSPLLL